MAIGRGRDRLEIEGVEFKEKVVQIQITGIVMMTGFLIFMKECLILILLILIACQTLRTVTETGLMIWKK